MASSDPNFTVSGVKSLAGEGGEGSPEATQMLNNFWQNMTDQIRKLTTEDFKTQELPLARIKKIMKLDEDVKMISAEAPMLFAKAAEIFISELSLRAWIHTEDNKRRTLQKNDIAMAVTKYDQFDFLIDIVPRDEIKPARKSEENVTRTSMVPDQVRYYLQLAQQHQAALQQQQPQAATAQQPQTQQIQIQTAGGQVIQQPIQIQVAGGANTQGNVLQVSQVGSETTQPQTQVIQVQAASQPQQQAQQQQQQQTTQVFQQIITPTGEVQNVPIQLTQEQIQALTSQMQGKQPGQPIMIQTAQPQVEQQQAQQQTELTQPLFQVPLNTVGGQQIFLQQAVQEGQDTDTIQVTQTEVQS